METVAGDKANTESNKHFIYLHGASLGRTVLALPAFHNKSHVAEADPLDGSAIINRKETKHETDTLGWVETTILSWSTSSRTPVFAHEPPLIMEQYCPPYHREQLIQIKKNTKKEDFDNK